ncbi:Eukaryotic translation initiation factor 2D [Labeo rohita]|uniref:Eukaryotic translation initiation factor 2D n=1 Tax=Labeo rohita TaxID=84645 RepID=A0ABQ8MEW2_LABRO|nr:Eukaryotic translation initiation factor 2D [Labeo rohita]
MFAKAFRVKSNTVIKGSDRRKLRADISASFPSLSAEDLNELIPNKEELNIVKIYAHKGDAVTLYVLHKKPIFFQLDKQLFPTVYTLWQYPAMLPAFVTWPPVLQKLAGGADLMLPGVVVPPDGLPEVDKGDCCAVTLVMNRAPVAVGTAAVSSAEMRNSGMKGKGVNILHTYMDQLAFGDKSQPPVMPVTNSPAQVEGETEGEECEEKEQEVNDSSNPAPVETSRQSMQELRLDEHEALKEEEPVEDKEGEDANGEEDSRSPQEQMDELLLQCFLHALKTKLSKFLHCMQKDHSLIQVKELSKGVESIVEVDWKNPELCSFSIPEDFEPEKKPEEESGASEVLYQPPEITTLYGVTARLEPLFQDAQKKKGTPLKAAEVRNIITEYVKKNELVYETNKNYVNINPTLCDCLLEKSEYQEVEKLKWDELFSRFSAGTVTIIKNLEAFGLDPAVVADTLQHQVQASCGLQECPGAKNRVLVQIQGNQVQQVGKLLLDRYKIPRKYVLGLDKAPKPGKKK